MSKTLKNIMNTASDQLPPYPFLSIDSTES